MRKLLVLSMLMIGFGFVGFLGCSTTTYNIQQPGNVDPGGESYKFILIRNEDPFYLRFSIGTANIVMDPGTEVVTKKVRPLGWLSPSFGYYKFMVYAYRQKHENGFLDEFVGQSPYYIYLDGRPKVYNGRVFGDVVVIKNIPVSPFGHPDHWSGNFLGIIPWNMEFRHR